MKKLMSTKSTKLLQELQALDFAILELALHSDSHHVDVNASIQHMELDEQRIVTRTELDEYEQQSLYHSSY